MYHKSFELARNFAKLSRVRARARGRISLPQSETRNRTKSADGGFLSRPLLFTIPLFSTFVTTRSSSFLACVLPQSAWRVQSRSLPFFAPILSTCFSCSSDSDSLSPHPRSRFSRASPFSYAPIIFSCLSSSQAEPLVLPLQA